MAIILKSRKQLPLLTADAKTVLPVLPIRSAVIFPGEVYTIQMGRKENLDLLQAVTEWDNMLVLSFSPQSSGDEINLSEVSVIAKVQAVKPALGGSLMVTLEGIRRVALTDIQETTPFILAAVVEVNEFSGEKPRLQNQIEQVTELVSRLIKLDSRYAGEMAYNVEMNRSDPGNLADRVAAMVHFQLAGKQEILESISIKERLETVAGLLNGEIEKISLSVQINNRVVESLEKKKKENYLRHQLREIRRELGEDFIEEDISRLYHKKIKENRSLPQDVSDRLSLEADRLKHLSSSSTEYGFSKNYLELMLSLPWQEPALGKYNLAEVEDRINAEYYGSGPTKEQILEYLAVRQSSQELHDLPILCLSGPVGTGKASLVKAMAGAIGRKFVRITGASLVTVDDIKGSPRSEIGAGPGQLVRAIQRAGAFDLVVFLEDLEYVIDSDDSNAILALLEAVDLRHNSYFVDNFVGVPLDFSRILFVLGISYIDDFPEPFAHRLEVVEMPGYIESEKLAITKRHILPKLYKQHGLTRPELKFSDRVLTKIIRHYTMEAGLIMLQQQLEKIFRKAARKKASSGNCKINMTEASVEQFLGTPQFIPEKATSQPEIGVATGLAWTGAGGDLMLIEGLKMRGTGQVIFTGSLGEIMKESIQAAHSFVRARAEMLGIDHNDFVNFDIHIHFPMGAIPKDGPSAGVTVSLVIASVMAERPIRNDIAMTGEVTLRGKVLSVGGIKEKVSAAYRSGIYTIIMPKENEKDIKSIPREIVRKTNFVFIETVDELFEKALLEFTPSSYTLEKIFAAEIEKAKKRSRSRSSAAKSRRKKSKKRR